MGRNGASLGTQPIRKLDNNVLAWFEGKYPEFRQELEGIGEKHGVTRAIKYLCDEAPILGNLEGDQLPSVTTDGGQITIHETFLSYIWVLSYSFLVIFDEKLHGPHTGRQPGHGKPLGYFLPKGYLGLNYAFRLIKEFEKWPSDLPSPETHNAEDRYFVERANAIYLAAIDFILCHELAHIACGHIEKLKRALHCSTGLITPSQIKKLEREADKWALERVAKGIHPPERSLTTVGFGAVVGLGSLLFLSRGLTSLKHPDKDHRIRHVLSGFDMDDFHSLWGVAVAFYVAWDSRFSVGLDFANHYKTYGALLRAVERQLKSNKQVPRKKEEHGFRLD